MQALIKDNAVSAYPYSFQRLRSDNPQTSYPSNPSKEVLEGFGVYDVAEFDVPSINQATQRVEETTPVFVDGKWTQAWAVIDLTAEEVAARAASQWASVRKERNAKLSACDWTQLADAPVDDLAWAVYRQALRDITTQTDPFNILWPISP